MRVADVTESCENLKYCFPFTLELPADLNPGCKRVLTQTHIIQCPHTLTGCTTSLFRGSAALCTLPKDSLMLLDIMLP